MNPNEDSKRRIVCAPVLVLAEDFFRGDLLRGDLEESGIPVQVRSTGEGAALGDGRWSLVLLSTVSLTDRERSLMAGLRARDPGIPILILHGKKRPDASSLSGVVLLPRSEGFKACRAAVFSLLGIAESDEPGTTIPGR